MEYKDIIEAVCYICGIIVSICVCYSKFSNRVSIIETKLEELCKKMDKHNNLVERTYKLEQRVDDLNDKIG